MSRYRSFFDGCIQTHVFHKKNEEKSNIIHCRIFLSKIAQFDRLIKAWYFKYHSLSCFITWKIIKHTFNNFAFTARTFNNLAFNARSENNLKMYLFFISFQIKYGFDFLLLVKFGWDTTIYFTPFLRLIWDMSCFEMNYDISLI